MAAIVEVRGLTVGFQSDDGGGDVLADTSLTVERGEFVVVVGPSGVGKSTLLRLVAGLLQPTAGEIRLLAEPAPDRRRTALVFQEPRLLPWRRVLGNATFGLEGLVSSAEERRRRAHAALDLVGLTDYDRRWPYQLSGGQRQRVGLARALAVAPDLLLMDEPFAALDAITRHRLQDELLRIWNETRTSVLFVTHDIDEAVYLADRVLLLGGNPATFVAEYPAPAQRPRRREDAKFRRTVEEIRSGISLSHDPPARLRAAAR